MKVLEQIEPTTAIQRMHAFVIRATKSLLLYYLFAMTEKSKCRESFFAFLGDYSTLLVMCQERCSRMTTNQIIDEKKKERKNTKLTNFLSLFIHSLINASRSLKYLSQKYWNYMIYTFPFICGSFVLDFAKYLL